MERKDKKKVIGEPMTDEQIRFFLDRQPEDGLEQDFYRLQRAYRSLRLEDFERFLVFFTEQGGKVDTPDNQNRTLKDIISSHQLQQEYAELLERFGG